MQYRFSFKQMEASKSLESLAKEKVDEKIRRFVTKPIEAHVVFSLEGGSHKIRCSITGGDGFNFDVEACSHDMYASVDVMAEKLVTQMKRQKEKLKSHKGHPKPNQVTELMSRKTEKSKRDGEYVEAEDILKFEAARKKRAAGGA